MFNVEVRLKKPKVPYRETVTKRVEHVEGKLKKQTGGAGMFGVCYLNVEPMPRSSGFEFVVTGERGVPYTVECSEDGEIWTPVTSQSADGSESDGPAGSFTFSSGIDSDTKLFRVSEGDLLEDDD